MQNTNLSIHGRIRLGRFRDRVDLLPMPEFIPPKEALTLQKQREGAVAKQKAEEEIKNPVKRNTGYVGLLEDANITYWPSPKKPKKKTKPKEPKAVNSIPKPKRCRRKVRLVTQREELDAFEARMVNVKPFIPKSASIAPEQ